MKATTLRTLLFVFCLLGASRAAATGTPTTAFTYQGQLRDGGTNAHGTYGLTFKLFDAVTNGNQISGTLTNSAFLVNGLFSVSLDFGADAFDEDRRWLDITVQSGTDSQTLAPREQVLPVPYALKSRTTANLNSAGIIVDSRDGISFPFAGNRSITADISGIIVDGIRMSANNGVTFPAPDRNRSISASTQGITIDDVIVGNYRIRLPSPNGFISLSGFSQGLAIDHNVHVTGFVTATSFNTTSDRNLKAEITAINSREILERVVRLPISTWKFKADGDTRHIGPMAQDFYAAFNVGTDDKHIATVDESGVALAAIQGLHEVVKEKDAEIAALKQRLTDLEKAVSALAKQKGVTP